MSNLIILYDYHEAPPFLLGNPNVRGGYRAYLPTKLCLKSLLVLHNESVNIWSHLLVGLYFFYQYFIDIRIIESYEGTDFYDYVAFISMIIAIQICMFASTGYHLFNCQSQELCTKMLLGDCVGIAIGLSGCFFPVMHYAFYCYPALKLVYGVVIGAIFSTAGYFITRSWFGNKEHTFFRIMTYALVSLTGIVPSAHWALLNGFDSEIVSIFLPRIGLLYLFAGVGVFFYVTMIPESLIPGKFDIFGHSHQVWHMFSALVFIVGHQTQQLLFLYVTSHPCTV